MLTPISSQAIPKSRGSAKKVQFYCDCGNRKSIRWSHYISGASVSCGKCAIQKWKEITKVKKFGSLRLKEGEIFTDVTQKVIWICDCGREKLIRVGSVIYGKVTSCFKCSEIVVFNGMIWNGFVYLGNEPILNTWSNKTALFRCKCGKEKYIKPSKISCGLETCGRCSLRPMEWWEGRRFGKLVLLVPEELRISSIKKKDWKCYCGTVKSIRVDHVTRGNIISCGDCRKFIYQWFLDNQEVLNTGILPSGGMQALEPIKNTVIPFKANCIACGDVYRPRLSDIKRGLSLTCGCTTYKISSYNRTISKFVESIGLKTELEFMVGNRFYDIGVPSHRVLIEFDGTRFHSDKLSKIRSKFKDKIASDNGYAVIHISEMDWKKQRALEESRIMSVLSI